MINPSNSTVLANIPISSPEELELAVQSAATDQKKWAKVDIKKRADLILQLCSRIEERVEKFVLMNRLKQVGSFKYLKINCT